MRMIRVENLIDKSAIFFNLDIANDWFKYHDILDTVDNDSLGISESDKQYRVRYICTYQKIIGFEPSAIHTCIIWARNKEDAAKATAKYLGCDWKEVEVNHVLPTHGCQLEILSQV